MADFRKACDYVLHNEDRTMSGKVTHDPTREDPNAVARFGVNSARHQELMDAGFFDPAKVSTEDALLAAENCFKYEYFMHLSGYQIMDQTIANKYSDLAFNEGVEQATKLVQRAVNALGRNPALNEDGIPGALTIAAINAYDEAELLTAIRAQAQEFYTALAAERPELAKDLPDWLARVNE